MVWSADSSQKIHLQGTILHSESTASDGFQYTSQVDLDKFIGNINGELQWGFEGFGQTSRELRLEGHCLVAECQLPSGTHYQKSSFNLSTKLCEENGTLIFIKDRPVSVPVVCLPSPQPALEPPRPVIVTPAATQVPTAHHGLMYAILRVAALVMVSLCGTCVRCTQFIAFQLQKISHIWSRDRNISI